MADFGSPVVKPVDPNHGLTTLSNLMALRGQRSQNISAQATAQQDTQNARQRAALAGIDWNKHVGSDGTLDLNSFSTDQEIREAAGDQYPEVMKSAADIKTAQGNAKQTLFNLTASQVAAFGGFIGSMRTDDEVQSDTPAGRQKIKDGIKQYGELYGPEAAKVAETYAPLIEHIPPGRLASTLGTIQAQGLDVAKQLSAQTPEPYTVDTGRQILPGQTQPLAPGGTRYAGGKGPGTAINREVGPQVPSTFTDQSGNQWSIDPLHPETAIRVGQGKPLPGRGSTGGGASKPSAGAPPDRPTVFEPGGAAAATAAGGDDQKLYMDTIKPAADAASRTKNVIKNIKDLASQTDVGPYTSQRAAVQTFLSENIPGFEGASDYATRRQLLGKYTAQLLQAQIAEGGPGTDQAEAFLKQSLPDPEHMTKEAIARAADFIAALTQMKQARGAVAEKYVREHGNNPRGLAAVDSQFMQHVDPRFFDYFSQSKENRSAWLNKNVGPAGSKEREAFRSNISVVDHYGGFDYARNE